MTQQSTNSSFINNSARCTHRFANGKRCRLSASNVDSAYCPIHASSPRIKWSPPTPSPPSPPTSRSSAPPSKSTTSSPVFSSFSHNKKSPRAAVLAYITNQLLRTLPAIDHEINPKPGKDEPVQIIWDMPGPDRNRGPKPDNNNDPQPQPTYADVRT